MSQTVGDDDKAVAAVVTCIRNTWGNSAPPVTASQVAKTRQALVEPATESSRARGNRKGNRRLS
jgi:hypothetical protein